MSILKNLSDNILLFSCLDCYVFVIQKNQVTSENSFNSKLPVIKKYV